jgi:FkbM family methyltransferase
MNIVQIGCYRLIDPWIKEYIDEGHNVCLIDANPDAIKEIKSRITSKNVSVLNCAIGSELKLTSFFKTGMGVEHDYVASLLVSHVNKHHHSNIEEIEILQLRIKDLCGLMGNDKIDILYIDAEGMEPVILNDILKYNLQVDCIVYETLHFNDGPMRNTYIQHGYTHKVLDHANALLTKTITPKFQ